MYICTVRPTLKRKSFLYNNALNNESNNATYFIANTAIFGPSAPKMLITAIETACHIVEQCRDR